MGIFGFLNTDRPSTVSVSIGATWHVSLRHPEASALKGMYSVDGSRDLFGLSERDFSLVLFLCHQAGLPMDASIDFGMNYDVRRIIDNPVEAINQLFDLGWLYDPSARDVLNSASAKNIAPLAAQYGIPASRLKKAKLVDAVLDSVSPDVLEDFRVKHRFFSPSEKGFFMLRSLYNERANLEVALCNLFADSRFKQAAAHLLSYYKMRPCFRTEFDHRFGGTCIDSPDHIITLVKSLLHTNFLVYQFLQESARPALPATANDNR